MPKLQRISKNKLHNTLLWCTVLGVIFISTMLMVLYLIPVGIKNKVTKVIKSLRGK